MDASSAKISLIVARIALLGLLLVAGYHAAKRGDPLSIAATFGLAAMLTVLISPLSWAHHYVIWLAGLWLVPMWLWRDGRQKFAQWLLVSACCLSVAHYVALDWAGRVGLLGIGATAWFIVASVAIARKETVQVNLPLAKDSTAARLAA
jgi:hypothetical protein